MSYTKLTHIFKGYLIDHFRIQYKHENQNKFQHAFTGSVFSYKLRYI